MSTITGSFSSALFISASGIRDAQTRLNAASHNIANMNTANFDPVQVHSAAVSTGGVSTSVEIPPPIQPPQQLTDAGVFINNVDLVTQGLDVILASKAFAANAKMMEVSSDTTKTIIDAIG